MLFMGIDIGTQGARVVVVGEDGQIAASESVAFARLNTAPEPERFEQAAGDWWGAAERAILACVAQLKGGGYDTGSIKAISVDGTSGTVLPLDSRNTPLYNALMYNDMRAEREAARVGAVCAESETKLGLRSNASFSLPRILWICENIPKVYEKTARFVHQADYIVGRLCGEFGVTDYSNALKTGYNLIDGEWPREIASLGLDPSKLPRVVSPGATIANVSAGIAETLGLSAKTLVVGGSTDGYASALAAGAVNAGDWASIIGTTFVLKGVTERLVTDPTGSGYSHKLPSGAWMFGGASNIGGQCINHRFDSKDFARYNETVDGLSPTGVLVYPLTGTGERFPFVDPKAKEFIVGNADDPRVLYAALMEGVGFVERLAYERMSELGCRIGGVVYTAGGACRSDEWLRIRASILRKRLKVPAVVDAAMGSAMIAAGSHFGTLERAVGELIRFTKTVDPVKEKTERFNELYHAFYEQYKLHFPLK